MREVSEDDTKPQAYAPPYIYISDVDLAGFLPAVAAFCPGKGAYSGEVNAINGQKTVLVVDDHRDIRDFTQIALEAAGYSVHTATEGEQALVMQRELPADLLVTDIFMPGREGMSTIEGFKAEFPGIRIIAMSAGGSTGKRDYLSAAMLVGADATLRKPFTADQLIKAVRTVM